MALTQPSFETSAQAFEPFEISPEGSSPPIISFIIALVLGFLSFAFYNNIFEFKDWTLLLPVSVFLGVSAAFVLLSGLNHHRNKKIIRVDPVSKVVQVVRKGLFTPKVSQSVPFANVRQIQVTKKISRSNNSKHTYYPVFAVLQDDSTVQLFVSSIYNRSRQCGEGLAKAVKLELSDDSQGGEVQVRSPEDLDKTVGEKLRKDFYRSSGSSAPVRLHSKIHRDLDALVIDIPRFPISSLGPLQKVVWIIMGPLAAGIGIGYYMEWAPMLMFCGFVFPIFAYVLLRSEELELTRSALVYKSGLFFLKRARTIPLKSLEELFVNDLTDEEDKEADQLLKKGEVNHEMHQGLKNFTAIGSVIIARSDDKTFSIGRVLSAEELKYLLSEMQGWIREVG